MNEAKPWAPAIPQVGDEIAVASHTPAERGGRLSTARKVRGNPREKVLMGQHGVNSKRTIPLTARGLFPRDYYGGIGDSADAMSDLDAVRAVILARVEQLGLSLSDLSKLIGGNQAYLQQFLRRGIPRVLPEDKREALAALLQVTPDALRGSKPGKGAPRAVPADAVAQTSAEQDMLRIFRAMSAEQQDKALMVLRALA